MKRNELGTSGLSISRIVFGSMGRRDLSATDQIRTIHASLDAGVTSIDTAPLYDFGEVERTVGRAIHGRRHEVELLSKVGLRWDDEHGDVLFEFTGASGVRRRVRRDSRPNALRRDLEESLQRLGTDHIDLCQIHHPDTRVPISESMGELERLACEGKIRAIGVSNFTPPQIEDAVAALALTPSRTPLASDQLEYSLLKRGPETEIFPLASKHRFGLLAYSPLDAGSLAGPVSRSAHKGNRPTFQPGNAAKINAALHECVEPIARRDGESLSTVCLAWLLHQSHVSGVVVGASHPDQAVANARASELALSEGDMIAIGKRFAAVTIDVAKGLGPRARAREFGRRARRRLRRLFESR